MRNLAKNLAVLAVVLGLCAWLTYGAWLLSGGSLFLTMALITAAVLAMAFALDRLIPDRQENRPSPQPPEAADPVEVPDTNPEPEPNWLQENLEWFESFEIPESFKPPAPIEAQEVERMRETADQGDAETQALLACIYDSYLDNRGEGVPKDDKEAIRWYRKAADQGYSFAQQQLSRKYEDGQGVLQDFVQAHAWMNLAVLNGRESVWLRSLEERMAPHQVAEAQKLAVKFQERIESLKSK